MSVKAVCTGCGKAFNAPDQYAGKKVKCKNCGAAFRVPELSGTAAPPRPAASAAKNPAPAATRPAPTTAAAAARKAASKPAPAPVAAHDDGQGEYDLSGGGDDWGALEAAAAAPAYAPSAAGAPIARAPAYAPPVAATSRGTMFPATAQPMSARHNAVAPGQGMHWLMMVQLGAVGLPVLLLVLGMIVPVMATPAILLASLVAMVFIFWGQIGILMAAAQEGGVCVLLYLFIPLYPLYFILTRFDEVSHHVIRTVAGFALMFGAIMLILSQKPG